MEDNGLRYTDNLVNTDNNTNDYNPYNTNNLNYNTNNYAGGGTYQSQQSPNINYSNNNFNSSPQKNGNSGLGIAAFILSLLGCTWIIGLILAIIDVARKDGKKKTFSIIAFVICGIWLVISLISFAVMRNIDTTSTQSGSSHVEKTTATTEARDEKETESAIDETEETNNKEKLSVGDTFTKSDFSITFAEFGEYKDYDEILAPSEGNKIVYAKFSAVNNGSSDAVLSFTDFEGYASGTNVEKYYGITSEDFVNLSTGRWGEVTVAFEIPVDSDLSDFEIEYTPNIWTEEKVVFVGEGDGTPVIADVEKQEISNENDSEVLKVGETYDKDGVKIEYLECGDLTDYSDWDAPASGNKIIYAKFNVTNESESDFSLVYWDFNCFADNKQVEAKYPGDEYSFSIDLSPGRNGSGAVAFEVPEDATNIQIEYTPNIWISKHVIFQYE